MYSPIVIEQNIRILEKAKGITLKSYAEDVIASRIADLEKILDNKGKLKRNLTTDEKEFIRNERLRCKFDFTHWARNYATINKSGSAGGGIGKLKLWTSQQILLDKIAKREEENYEIATKGGIAPGILIADHKGGRQIGHTGLSRTICMHRELWYGHTRGMAASIDDDKIEELYRRDKLIIDNLPWWMRPELKFDTKAGHVELNGIGSMMLYQVASQKTGIGQGRSFDIAHLTEVAFFADAKRLELEFFPTLPEAKTTFCLMETTANGRVGWWKEFVDRVRRGLAYRWTYSFLPWYAEPTLYRRTPPTDWKPKETTILCAEVAKNTSYDLIGKQVDLGLEQLYWWETERSSYQERGSLNVFLTNYATTPEESFQFSGMSAFSTELIEEFRAKASWGMAFEVARV